MESSAGMSTVTRDLLGSWEELIDGSNLLALDLLMGFFEATPPGMSQVEMMGRIETAANHAFDATHRLALMMGDAGDF